MKRAVLALVMCLVSVPVVSEAQNRGRFNQYQSAMSSLPGEAVQNISIPVLFGIEVADLTKNFGDPRSGGRSHEGLDILSPEWTPIVSPTDAVVTSTGNGSSSGIYVRTANPGGETFVYMHLVAVANGIQGGTVVKRGDVLGFVGNTGNAAGGPAHLHFEIRKNGATDPYDRLSSAFTDAERMQSAEQALERSPSSSVASIYASKFKALFMRAQQSGLTVPSAIAALLSSSATPTVPATTGSPFTLVPGDTGAEVTRLQKFLIEKNAGAAALKLKASGATGYFGPVTGAALKEYQSAASVPATGLVDPDTYQLIFVLGQQAGMSDPDAIAESDGSRDLELGMEGEDVRALQVLLNAKGFTISQNGPGSPGQESNYFGMLTQKALARYQSATGISPAAGYFGAKTRARMGL